MWSCRCRNNVRIPAPAGIRRPRCNEPASQMARRSGRHRCGGPQRLQCGTSDRAGGEAEPRTLSATAYFSAGYPAGDELLYLTEVVGVSPASGLRLQALPTHPRTAARTTRG